MCSSDLGLNLLLYMSTICDSFRDYLNLVPSILRLRGDIGEVFIKRDGEFIRLEWHPLQQATRRERYLSDEVLTSSAAIVNTLCIDAIPVRRAHFTYPEPVALDSLHEHFGEELHFDQPVSCLYFDRSCLNLPVIKLDYEVEHDWAPRLEDLFGDELGGDPFLHSVRQFVARALPLGEVSIDHIATEVGVSRRTLQRRLAQRDTHFMQV